jgi:cation:H+ antiporter
MLYLELLGGLVLLFVGGEFLVRGAVSLARKTGVSSLLIGLVLVGFGTSMPELVASLQAARAGYPGLAVGNVVGSNIANVLLILGLAAVISPVLCRRAAFTRDGAVAAGATVLLMALAWTGEIGRGWGIALLAMLVAYAAYSYLSERRGANADGAAVHEAQAQEIPTDKPVWISLAVTLGGMAALLVGADMLVDSAVVLARSMGVTEAVIGLTLVALGTSLPELATCAIAAARGHSDVAFGNVIGSNIFNILGILGVTAIVQPLAVPEEIADVDVWVMAGSLALLAAVAFTSWRIRRAEGALFLVLYAGYIGWQFVAR